MRPAAEVDRLAAPHLAEVDRKFPELAAPAREPRRKSGSCKGGGTMSNCRILEANRPDPSGRRP